MQIIPGKLAAELANQYHEYSAHDIRTAWQANTDHAHISMICLDSKYRTLSLENWQKVMAESDTHAMKYEHEFRDCDDFAWIFKAEVSSLEINGCAFVIDVSGQHSFNIAVIGGEDKPSFRLIEPQLDNWAIANSSAPYNMKGQGIVIL